MRKTHERLTVCEIEQFRANVVYLRDEKKLTYKAIGAIFSKDHATIIHHYRCAKNDTSWKRYAPTPHLYKEPVKENITPKPREKYEHLYQVKSVQKSYDDYIKDSDNVTKMLANITAGIRDRDKPRKDHKRKVLQ